MNRDGRKGPGSPQQREKLCDVFCHPSGQSPWSCRVTSASLRSRLRRVRCDLSVLLFIYRLLHLPGHILAKQKNKWWEAPSLLRNVPLAQALSLHFAWLGSSRMSHRIWKKREEKEESRRSLFFSVLLHPPHSWDLPSSAQVCPRPRLFGQVPLSSEYFWGIFKAWRGFIPPTDFRGFYPSMILSRISPSPHSGHASISTHPKLFLTPTFQVWEVK